MLHDLRFAIRQLRKHPGFAAAAILTLGLGIGANTAIFTVVNSVLLKPLPYPDAGRIVRVEQAPIDIGLGAADPQRFMEGSRRIRTFEHISAWASGSVNLGGAQAAPERARAAAVSTDFFEVFGRPLQLGRALDRRDHAHGRNHVAVLGHGAWRRRFGGDPSALGKDVLINGRPYTVVGVAGREFDFPDGAEIWFPAFSHQDQINTGGALFFHAVARLRPGVLPAEAQAELEALLGPENAAPSLPAGFTRPKPRVAPILEDLVGRSRRPLLVLFAAVGFVLLIGCANVTNLLLARAAARRREIAVRRALGARGWQIARQMLAESAVTALAGGALGALLAAWSLDVLLALHPEALPRADEIRIDPAALGFALGASLLTALLSGFAPALRSARSDVGEELKGTTAGRGGRHRFGKAVVAGEIALTLVLLAGAGVMIRSLHKLLSIDPGFRPANVLTAEIHLPEAMYPDRVSRAAFLDRLLEGVQALPGVHSAAVGSLLPLGRSPGRGLFGVDGVHAFFQAASGDYFRALGIPVRQGRPFDSRDTAAGLPVIVVSESLGRRLAPGGTGLVGKKVKAGGESMEVIGVAGDVRDWALGVEPYPTYYRPIAQTPPGTAILVLRTTTDPLALAPAVRRELHRVDPGLPLHDVRTMPALASASAAPQRFQTATLAAFAGLALLLAAVGIHGVMSYSVARRTHELGVRMALGAQRREVLGMVMRHGLRLTGAGIALGLAAAAALTRVLRGLLHEVQPADPAVLAAASALLAAAALAACWLPARRATRIDPMTALKHE